MSPRPYRLGRRQAETDQTRTKILEAALELLAGSSGFATFTIDAVARQAGVARMTVYYQFESKQGLLEALLDFLALRGGIEKIATAFQRPDAYDAFMAFVALFGHFWTLDRLVMRRLNALAALDPEIDQAHTSRKERRREGLRILVQRLSRQYGKPSVEMAGPMVDLLFTLTSFESFDMLAGPSKTPEEVVPIVQKLVRAAIDLDLAVEIPPTPGSVSGC